MADNALAKLPLAGQLGVAFLVAAIICGGFYWFYYSDALEEQKRKEQQLAELQVTAHHKRQGTATHRCKPSCAVTWMRMEAWP